MTLRVEFLTIRVLLSCRLALSSHLESHPGPPLSIWEEQRLLMRY